MRSAICVLRRVALLAFVAVVGGTIAPLSLGQTVDVALNVRYTIPGDIASGGTWRLVARSSAATFGISALQVNLTAQSITGTPSAAGPIGVVNGDHDAGFSIFETATISNQKLLAISQQGRIAPLAEGQEQSIFYGVGTLANGAPNFPGKPVGTNSIGPAFTTLSSTARIPWATSLDSLGDPLWSTAAGLATGSFRGRLDARNHRRLCQRVYFARHFDHHRHDRQCHRREFHLARTSDRGGHRG